MNIVSFCFEEGGRLYFGRFLVSNGCLKGGSFMFLCFNFVWLSINPRNPNYRPNFFIYLQSWQFG